MSIQKKLALRKTRRTYRVRNHLREVNRSGKLRVSVFRSNKDVYVQVIDDAAHKTLLSHTSVALTSKDGDKTAQAKLVGVELGKRVVEQGLGPMYFDRGSFLYHGRVKAVADGLRESGVEL